MVTVALALRLLVMSFAYTEQLNPERDHWRFGYEEGRVARAIAQGRGFSDPLFTQTGPTAMVAPVYPYMIAGVFKIFGIYTKTSALAVLSFNALISALTCVPIFFIARRSFGERMGCWAGWAWAVFPYAVYFPVQRIWETWLATLLLTLVLLATLYLEEYKSLWMWAGFGLLWGIAGLNSPVVLAVLPFLTAWACWRIHQRGKKWFAPGLLAALVFIAVVSPWFVRNYRAFHKFIPFRDTMGSELRVGNNGDSFNRSTWETGPWKNDAEWTLFQQLGEINYMARQERLAREFISSHPGAFVWMSLRRAGYWWTGFWTFEGRYYDDEPLEIPNIFFCSAVTLLGLIGFRRAFRADAATALPYALVLLVFPVVYYITHMEAWYRRPVDPLFVILGVYAVFPRRRCDPEPERESLVQTNAVAESEAMGRY